ncbi:hypothetical protein BV22DRAFT_1108527 [Leucogyrophana mollusca]|uniref:Uncharacterized protein n=1 Tax=Leucogyrophana mollusca TaxID=85980 RepID=A0ACB8AZ11_9AGAM|nr:hypothetical protein BV22DRAFT_1108527 [Leucogyrophana mollusca]
MCPSCRAPFFSLCHPSCFDPTTFEAREDWRYLKYSFRARGATAGIAETIAENRGVRWSIFNVLPGWTPAGSQVVEFMHAVFLTMVKHLTKVIILKSGLLTGAAGGVKPLERLETFFANLVWPVEAARLPPSHNGEIPDVSAMPSPPNSKNAAAQITMQKSPDDVCRGCDMLSRATQSWARMGCHLTPYFHFAQHLKEQFLKFGPAYGTWAFGFERHNGTLAKFNHNQHKGGKLEGTMMRRWWAITFNYDLVSTTCSITNLLMMYLDPST